MSTDIALTPSTENTLGLDLADGGTQTLSGARKLAMQAVRYLLTIPGTNVTQPLYGSQLAAVAGGNVDARTIGQLASMAIRDAGAWLVTATKRNAPEEALEALIYRGSTYDGFTLTVSFTVLNRAGQQVSITLPVTS